jgi:methionine synthase II (cobalamin-independent)
MKAPKRVLPATLVGSYPQPEWLVDRAMLSKSVSRTRMQEIRRVPEPYLEQAQDDATIAAIRDMERAGIDIVTDGEIRRESYSNRYATALEGIDANNPAIIMSRSRQATPVLRMVDKIRCAGPVELRDMEHLFEDREHPCWNAEAERRGAAFHLRSRPLVSGGALNGSVNDPMAASPAVSDCTLCRTTMV